MGTSGGVQVGRLTHDDLLRLPPTGMSQIQVATTPAGRTVTMTSRSDGSDRPAGPLRLHVFETLTGNPVVRRPFTDVSWKESINSAGQLTMTLKWSRAEAGQLNLKDKLEPWKYTLAVLRGNTVMKAGMVVRPNWDAGDPEPVRHVRGHVGYLGHMLGLDSLLKPTSVRAGRTVRS